MDILDIRAALRKKSIYDVPLRVTYYARVSSDSDEQLNSLDNQISYYENFIKKNKSWTYVPGYVDEGLSGISTKKRKHFNEMIEDAKEGMFDLIITKEISRFARNTLDSLQYTRDLLSCGVGVFFQNDNINTLRTKRLFASKAKRRYMRRWRDCDSRLDQNHFIKPIQNKHTNYIR